MFSPFRSGLLYNFGGKQWVQFDDMYCYGYNYGYIVYKKDPKRFIPIPDHCTQWGFLFYLINYELTRKDVDENKLLQPPQYSGTGETDISVLDQTKKNQRTQENIDLKIKELLFSLQNVS